MDLASQIPRLNVFNRQQRFYVEGAHLKDFLCRLYCRLGLETGFSVVLVDDASMRNYNRQFRGEDGATDVLSFPCGDDDGQVEPYLGDIFICVDVADRQKKGNTLTGELKVLSLHGLLHLLGYDHETDEGEMESLERELRRELQLH